MPKKATGAEERETLGCSMFPKWHPAQRKGNIGLFYVPKVAQRVKKREHRSVLCAQSGTQSKEKVT